MALRREIGEATDESGDKEDYTNGDGNPGNGLLAILDEQGAYDNGTNGTENAALKYFHCNKWFGHKALSCSAKIGELSEKSKEQVTINL